MLLDGNVYYIKSYFMEKRIELLSIIVILSFVLIEFTNIFDLSFIFEVIALCMAIIVFGYSIVNLFLIKKQQEDNNTKFTKRIIMQILFSILIIVKYFC